MHTVEEQIKSLMQAWEQDTPADPCIPDKETMILRINLIAEEFSEFLIAYKEQNLVEMADGLVDLLVVTVGACVAMGLPLDTLWNEVLRSNLSKIQLDGKVLKDASGKVQKPDGYIPPNLKQFLT